jgi:hypothetical protein
MRSRIQIDMEYLKQVYAEENSIPKTAARSGLSYGTVRSRLLEAGVTLKSRGGQCVGDEKMTNAERTYKHRKQKKKAI